MVERGGLEIRCTRERTVGSNASPSAIHKVEQIHAVDGIAVGDSINPDLL